MVRRIFVIALLLLMIAVRVNVEAAPSRVLKVGYLPNTGFVAEDWSGHVAGYGYEYMEYLSNYGSWSFTYVPCRSWEEMGAKLNSGEIDLMPCMPGNYKLIPNSVRTDHVVGRFPMELIVDKRIGEKLKPKMRIGTVPANYPTPGLAKIAQDEGVEFEMVTYNNYADIKYALYFNEIDGYVDAMIDPNSSSNVFAIFDRQSYRLLVHKDNTQLLAELNAAMDQMLLDQPNIRDRLNNKYLRKNGFPLLLNRSEREYLADKKILKAVVIAEQKPFAYSSDGELRGAIPDIMNRIAKDLNVEIDLTEKGSIVEAAELIQSGDYDFIANVVCDYSWASNFNVHPTQSYLSIDFVHVTRQGELPEGIVACLPKQFSTKTSIETRYPEDQRLYCDDLEDCFRAVSDGRANILFAPRRSVPFLVETTDTYNLEAGSETYFTESIGLGVYQYANPLLWHILNKEINHLDGDFLRAMVSKNQEAVVHFTPQWFIYHHPIKVILIMLAIGAIIGGIVWYRNKMRRKHIEIVKKMAYTDSRYDLPNVAWLENEIPEFFDRQRDQNDVRKIYTVVFSMQTKASVVERYGDKLLNKQMRDMADQMNQKGWVIYTAAGIDSGHLICICKAIDEAQMIEFVAAAIERYSFIETTDARRIWLHMRAGICELRRNDFSVRQTIERANVACHKQSTSDINVFDNAMQEDITLQHKIELSMEKALADGEFKAFYQPKYDIRTRKIIGAEALVRWISPEMGFMPPGKFIPLFEKNGFVISIDYELLDQAFRLQKQRLLDGKEVVPISVNQSRLHMSEEGYLDKIRAIIDKYGISPKGIIELELTETVFGDFDQKENQKRAADIVAALHEMGFTISVDDFGSGYSSFMLLNYLPMDVMKIDRSLLNAAGGAKRTRDILANVIALGKTLNMEIICEGIETSEQEQLLLDLGCYYGQGFLNAKPMPLDDFVAFFEKRNAEVAARLAAV